MDLGDQYDKEFKIISYNIFFGILDGDTKQDIDLRIQYLCAQLQSLDADVICMQEVMPDRYERIKDILYDVYPYYYPDKITQTYDTAIISKHPFLKRSKISYSITNMKRSIQFVSIRSPFDPTKTIGIATSHLESEFGDTMVEQNVKMVQYSEAEDIIDQVYEMCGVTDLIFCGDFNSHNDLSDATLYNYFRYRDGDNSSEDTRSQIRWRDAWIETGRDPYHENTFDSTTNQLMKKLHSKLEYIPYYVSRLDRILHRSSLHAHDFRMVKTDLIISDHYPIMTTFKDTPPRLIIPYVEYDPDKVSISRTRVRKQSSKTLTAKLKSVSLFK